MSGDPVDASARQDMRVRIAMRAQTLVSLGDRIGRSFAADHDLGASDFRALLAVLVAEREGRPLTPTQLGRDLGLSSAAMTYLVERLVASGHLLRERDSADGRRVILRYADHGYEVAAGFFGPLGDRTATALEDVSEADLAVALRVMDRITGAFAEHLRDLDDNRADRAPAE